MDTSFGGELMKNVWKKRKDNKIKRKQRKSSQKRSSSSPPCPNSGSDSNSAELVCCGISGSKHDKKKKKSGGNKSLERAGRTNSNENLKNVALEQHSFNKFKSRFASEPEKPEMRVVQKPLPNAGARRVT